MANQEFNPRYPRVFKSLPWFVNRYLCLKSIKYQNIFLSQYCVQKYLVCNVPYNDNLKSFEEIKRLAYWDRKFFKWVEGCVTITWIIHEKQTTIIIVKFNYLFYLLIKWPPFNWITLGRIIRDYYTKVTLISCFFVLVIILNS